jgi:hypothetical protein
MEVVVGSASMPELRVLLDSFFIDDGRLEHRLYSFARGASLEGESKLDSFHHWNEVKRSLLLSLRRTQAK